jgi:Flp pilus assembly protein TadG
MSNTTRFISDKSGNFAIMFSFVAVPIMLAAGIAVDYTNLLRLKTELQAAADSAVLAVAVRGDTINDAEAYDIGDAFFDENFGNDFTNLSVTRNGQKVQVSAKTKVPLAFGGFIGMSEVVLSAVSNAEIANVSYEIALALDTTGSMKGGKLAAMKEAVKSLVDDLSAQNAQIDSLKFSVVPFAAMVNVGPQFGPQYDSEGNVTQEPASWLDATGNTPVVQNDLDGGVSRFALYKNLDIKWSGCVESRGVSGGVDYGANDEEPNLGRPETLFVPSFASDEPDDGGFSNNYLPDNAAAFGSGTAVDRMARYGAEYDVEFKSKNFVEQIAESAEWTRKFKNPSRQGPNSDCTTQPILPLTTDFQAVKNKVDSLVASGSTNIFEGASWGWRTLSREEPFTQGAPKIRRDVQKILIVLTDGSNFIKTNQNQLGSPYSSFGYLTDGRLGLTSGSQSQLIDAMNDKTKSACDNAKAEGITIYTVKLEEPDVETGSLLRDCASSAENYIDVPDRSLLKNAFSKIVKKIALVRLSS